MTLHEQIAKEYNIQPGDTVKVLRKAKSFEMDWNAEWDSEMDGFVGKEYTVEIVDFLDGVYLGDFWFPAFVLEKVNSVELKIESSQTTYNLKVSANSIELPCGETFPVSIIDDLIEAYNKAVGEDDD